CVLCGRTDDCPEKYGEKRTYVEYNLTVHYYCLLMSSGIWQRPPPDEGVDGFLIADIRPPPNRAAKLKPPPCRKKGASIGCVAPPPPRSYHFPCGIQKESPPQFMEDFRYVLEPVQMFPDNPPPGTSQCTICLDLVAPPPVYTVLKSPCCKNPPPHRECLQALFIDILRMVVTPPLVWFFVVFCFFLTPPPALSAGIFFFRCTVPPPKDKFQKEMLRMGTPPPEKDASWELEPPPYQDLLQCYQHCDTPPPLCKKGRDYNEPDTPPPFTQSKWAPPRCQCCGSRGTHLAPPPLTSWEQNWECVECPPPFAKSGKYRKQPPPSLATSEKTDGTACPPPEPSPKCPRQSPGSPPHFLIQSPPPMSQNTLLPCSHPDLPASNRVTMSLSPLMPPPNWSRRKMHSRNQTPPLSNILRELKLQINTKTTRLNINVENIWSSPPPGFRQRNFSPTNTTPPQFTNCKNRSKTDTSAASKHRFFQLLMLHLPPPSLFEGSSAKNLSPPPQAPPPNLYFEAGKMIAVSPPPGGPSPGFFSKTLSPPLVYGPENVKPVLEPPPDHNVAQTIKMIKYASSLSSLQSAVHNCYEVLAAAPPPRPVTALCDRNMLVPPPLTHHVIKRITSPSPPLVFFRQGLKTPPPLEKMQTHPDAFSSILCHKPERLSAKTLCDLFTIHSSSEVDEAEGADFWMGYLQDVESGESAPPLEDILLFVTGCFSIPPSGFNPEPTIKFLHPPPPIGNRLLNCLELPPPQTYEQFKSKMEFTPPPTRRVERE
ncbi:G2E3 ligase, partial [Trogon melanurus]|nr:G2E3 ligase [Trogon melanurus]